MLSFYFRPEDVFEKYEVGWGFKMAFSVLKVKPSILLCLNMTNLNPLSLDGLVVPLIIILLQQFNPLGVMRLSGPWGPGLATSRRWKCQIYVSTLILPGCFSIEPSNFWYQKGKGILTNQKISWTLVGFSVIYIHRPDLARKFIPLLGEEDSVQVDWSATINP